MSIYLEFPSIEDYPVYIAPKQNVKTSTEKDEQNSSD